MYSNSVMNDDVFTLFPSDATWEQRYIYKEEKAYW